MKGTMKLVLFSRGRVELEFIDISASGMRARRVRRAHRQLVTAQI
jgi:hypothetical protein